MRIRCLKCSKSVSTEVPEETVVRAAVECPECLEKAEDPAELRRQLNDLERATNSMIHSHDQGTPCNALSCPVAAAHSRGWQVRGLWS